MSAAHVVFAVTCYGPAWPPAIESWLACVAKTSREMTVSLSGSLRGVGVTDRMYTSSAGNRLVDGFLAIENATHIFMTEIDMILDPECIMRLVEVDQDIVSGVYFLRNGWGQPCLYRQIVTTRQRKSPEIPYAMTPVTLFPQDTPFKLGDANAAGCPGLGCVLIKRTVFETIPSPWFRILENRAGSDLYFYRTAHDHGFDVWVDPRVRCAQIDNYVTDISDYHHRLTNDPDFGKAGYIIGAQV